MPKEKSQLPAKNEEELLVCDVIDEDAARCLPLVEIHEFLRFQKPSKK
jgi:hypothetical protein